MNWYKTACLQEYVSVATKGGWVWLTTYRDCWIWAWPTSKTLLSLEQQV